MLSRRGWQIVAGVFVVLLVVGIGLKLYFTSDRLKTMILPRLSQALNRTVEVQEVGLGVWGGLHMWVQGLVVNERSGFGAMPFVQVDRADFGVAFWPLLSGEVALSEVALRGPRISVVISAQGEANYEDLTEETGETEQTDETQTSLKLPLLIIGDGALAFVDQRDGFVLDLAGLRYRLNIDAGDLETAFNGDLSAERLAWGKREGADSLNTGMLQVVHRVRMGEGGTAWTVEALEARWGKLGLTASGKVRTLADATEFDLRIDEPEMDLSGIAPVLDDTAVRVGGTASVSAAISGRLKTTDPPVYPDVRAKVALKGVTASGTDLPGEVALDTASVVFEDGVLRLAVLKGRALGGDLAASGKAEGLWPPGSGQRVRVQLDLQADSLGIPETQASGTAEESSEGMPAWVGEVDADVALRAKTVSVGELVMRDLKGRIRLVSGQVQAEGFQTRVFGGTVRVAGGLDARKPGGPFPVQTEVSVDGVELKNLPANMLGPGYEVAGSLSASALASGTLDEKLKPVLRPEAYRLSGQAKLMEGTARMPNLKVPVDALEATLVLQPGDALQIEQFTVRAGRTDALVSGRVNGAIDYLMRPEAGARPRVKLAMRSRTMDMDSLFIDPATLPGDQDLTSGALVFARTADGTIDAQIGTLVSGGIAYNDVRAIVEAKNGVLQIDSIRASVFGGTVAAQAEIDARPTHEPVPMQAVASLTRVEASQVLQNFLEWPIPLRGQMGTQVAVEGKMDSTLTLIETTLTAEGVARVDEGQVVNWPWLQKASEFVPHMQFLDFSNLPLKDLVAPFRIDSGRVFLDEVGFLSGNSGFRLTGSAGLDGTLDVTMNADLPASRLNISALGLDRIPGLNVKPDARIPLQVHIGGTAQSPKVESKLQPEAQQALEAKKEALQEKAVEKGKEKAKSILESLF